MLTTDRATNTKSPYFKLENKMLVKDVMVCNKFINWVIGEFDLYLKNESEVLKVYFPNGWFSISSLKKDNKCLAIEIKIEGKSRASCDIIMIRLTGIFDQVVNLYSKKI